METCPHGSRIVCAVNEPVVFIDDCQVCQDVLNELGFSRRPVAKETVHAA